MLKNILFLLISTIMTITMVTSCSNAGSDKVIRIGISCQMAPYSYYHPETNKPVGFDVDIANEIAKRLNKKLELSISPYSRIIFSVKSNQIDCGMGSMNIVPERQKVVNFTVPYNISRGMLVVNTKNNNINSIEELKNSNILIGIRNGTVYPYILKDKYNITEELLKIHPSQRDLRIALEKGMIDAAISDYAAMYHLKNKENINIKFIGTPLNETPCGITVNKNNETLLKDLNSTIEDIIADGTYEKIAKKWFGINPLKEKPIIK